MNRPDFIVSLIAASATSGARPSAVSADIAIKRDANELLAPFTVSIALHNATQRIVPLDFPTAELYRIDVQHEDRTVWSTATGHKPIQIARRLQVPPGTTRLVSQIVDGTTDDRRAYEPGRYVVRVAMLGSSLSTTLERALDFAPPLRIADALKTKTGTVVTIAGVPAGETGAALLKDDTGSLKLSRPLGVRPTGKYVVRGYLDALGNDMQFDVGRFAPAFDNVLQARPAPSA
ncbi:MAG: BsuPI-related putative proteinase inhibitor [Candidatus Velthaea sp.]